MSHDPSTVTVDAFLADVRAMLDYMDGRRMAAGQGPAKPEEDA